MIEFNQLAMTHAQGSDVMLNRVMTKDNIALAALLETKDTIYENASNDQTKQYILLATCHIHWDPEFCDVKLIQVSSFYTPTFNFTVVIFKLIKCSRVF